MEGLSRMSRTSKQDDSLLRWSILEDLQNTRHENAVESREVCFCDCRDTGNCSEGDLLYLRWRLLQTAAQCAENRVHVGFEPPVEIQIKGMTHQGFVRCGSQAGQELTPPRRKHRWQSSRHMLPPCHEPGGTESHPARSPRGMAGPGWQQSYGGVISSAK